MEKKSHYHLKARPIGLVMVAVCLLTSTGFA